MRFINFIYRVKDIGFALGLIRWWGWSTTKYYYQTGQFFYLFRNRQSVIPGRWGFGILGLEFGSRNPGNKFGMWLKRNGLYPW